VCIGFNRLLVGLFEHDNKPSGCIKARSFLNSLNKRLLLKEDPLAWSWAR
jgi:hypothetical protein